MFFVICFWFLGSLYFWFLISIPLYTFLIQVNNSFLQVIRVIFKWFHAVAHILGNDGIMPIRMHLSVLCIQINYNAVIHCPHIHVY
jgi:hypothetical protein